MLACLLVLSPVSTSMAGVLRIVAYNTYNNPDDTAEDAPFSTIFSAIGNESVGGIAKRIDVLALAETDTGSSVRLAGVLNGLYDTDAYEIVTSSSVGGDRTGVLYDSSTLALLEAADLTHIGVHPILRARFRPVGVTGSGSDFCVYAVHLKAGLFESDITTRAAEAVALRNDADALGKGANIIYAGDFNIFNSSEGAWVNMIVPGNGQAFDTADSPGEWHDNEAFKLLHTRHSSTDMNARLDLMMVSGELLDGGGFDGGGFDGGAFEYLPDSFHVFGNNGTHTFGAPIGTGTGASPDVLAALELASDHLPIVADYRFSPVPEPATPSLLVLAGLCLAVSAWRRRRC